MISTPIERQVPMTMLIADWRLLTPMSVIFLVAISLTWSMVILPTLILWGSAEPLASLMVCLISSETGGVLRTKVKVRSSKIVIKAGMTWPRIVAVLSLYCLTNSMILTPC